MTNNEFEMLTGGCTPRPNEERQRLLAMARSRRDIASRMYVSPSGADQVDAYAWDLCADAYGCIAYGASPDVVISWAKGKWCAYAVSMREKVSAAPKIRMGPSAGHSVISHRWTSDEFIDSMLARVKSCR